MGALALFAAEFLPIYSVHVTIASCEDLAQAELADACSKSGGEQHAYGLVLLAALIAAMGVGAAMGGSRPAGYALAACAVAALAIVIVLDYPDTSATGLIGERFEDAEASPQIGFWLELAGSLLALGAGGLAIFRR